MVVQCTVNRIKEKDNMKKFRMKYVTYPWHGLFALTWHLVQQNNKRKNIRQFYPSTIYKKVSILS
jgi:hypothetical protein